MTRQEMKDFLEDRQNMRSFIFRKLDGETYLIDKANVYLTSKGMNLLLSGVKYIHFHTIDCNTSVHFKDSMENDVGYINASRIVSFSNAGATFSSPLYIEIE